MIELLKKNPSWQPGICQEIDHILARVELFKEAPSECTHIDILNPEMMYEKKGSTYYLLFIPGQRASNFENLIPRPSQLEYTLIKGLL